MDECPEGHELPKQPRDGPWQAPGDTGCCLRLRPPHCQFGRVTARLPRSPSLALPSLNPQQPQEVSERPGGGGRGPGEHRELLPDAAGQVALGASWRPRGPARPVSVPHPSVAPRGSREKCQPPAHAARPLARPPAEVSPPKLHTAPHGPAHSPRALRTGCTFCQFPTPRRAKPHSSLRSQAKQTTL